MGRLYRINPTCPHCHEEHITWNIRLADEEQEKMDRYVDTTRGKSSIEVLLNEPGIIVTRTLKCCCCGEIFEAHVGLWESDEVGYSNQDYVGVCQIPL